MLEEHVEERRPPGDLDLKEHVRVAPIELGRDERPGQVAQRCPIDAIAKRRRHELREQPARVLGLGEDVAKEAIVGRVHVGARRGADGGIGKRCASGGA